MNQMKKNIYSVGQVNTYIKNMFTQDFFLQRINVQGEVSNCKYHSSGHIYFTLKDQAGAINCIMFAGNRKGLTFPMKDGDKVVVTGSIEVYERDGKYQLYARTISLYGEGDLYRRYEALKETCRDKRVLEFGCGNGGFLRRIKEVAADVTGIELMDEARKRISLEGIKTFKTLSETQEKHDVICMFMVIEHLNNPDDILSKIYDVLVPGGMLIVETVNSDDALISKYSCKNFMDFTYWSEHVILFNSITLETLIKRNGFITNWNTQIQRYSLANHLYWLAHGKPGGHMKWTEFNEKELNDAYEKKLVSLGIADTLWYIGTKK